MSLGVYLKPKATALVTSQNPFRVTFDGRTGGVVAQQVFVRNDDIRKSYLDISILAIDSLNENLVDGSTSGWEWKLASKSVPVTGEEWDTIDPGSTLTLPDIGSTTLPDIHTYLPVWVYVKIPRNQAVRNITDIVLRILATEILV